MKKKSDHTYVRDHKGDKKLAKAMRELLKHLRSRGMLDKYQEEHILHVAGFYKIMAQE